ncbi:alpha/beta hydrolase [Tepidicaulis sp. LMO-SS28]|uniref:alpha/beta hydrolase n=1 Tax=Tepidicaulis sp. LMO-SS28 TaxID=3447455 RepID=UPI003EE0D937
MTEFRAPLKLSRPDSEEIAYLKEEAGKKGRAGLVWLGGFKSDMTGTKAEALATHARKAGHAYLRFDYFGHGASSGHFAEGTVGRWKEDALAAIDELTEGPLVLVGSSMGGWMALLAALARLERVKGLVLIAPAPDFTEELMWKRFSPQIKETLQRDGVYLEPTQYADEPNEITLKLIEEGRNHLLLGKPIPLTCPVRILQGMADPDVPWQHAVTLAETLESEDVLLSLSKNGDHRLSTPEDIARLEAAVDEVLARV